MASEIIFAGSPSQTCYFVVSDRTGRVWNTSGGTGAFESFSAGSWTDYAISSTEQGGSHRYTGTFPAAIPAGVYGIDARKQVAGSASQTDPTVAVGDFQWNGSSALPLSDLASSGQVGLFAPTKLARGVMVQNFPLYLKSASDHITPFTSGVVSGQISRDGGAFGALQSGAFTEKGLGWFNLQALTSGDLLCNTCALLITANGISGGTSDPLPLAFVLQKVSGQL